jgi:hypothetical protein
MRFDLSDEDWALLEPLLPKSRKSARAVCLFAKNRFSINGLTAVHGGLHEAEIAALLRTRKSTPSRPKCVARIIEFNHILDVAMWPLKS